MTNAPIPPQRNRISIRGMIKDQEKATSKSETESNKYASAQQKVRELLLQRAKGSAIQIEDIRDIAVSTPGQTVVPPKKTKLSLAKAKGEHIPRITVTSNTKNEKTQNNPTLREASSNAKSATEQRTHQPLKDSVYFLTDREYEMYLQDELQRQGLFRELFEQFKIFYISRQDIHALMGIFEHLKDMDLSPCQMELEKAEAFRTLGDWDKTFLYLDKAIRIEPTSTTAMRALAFYHKYREEYDLSMHWFDRWSKLEPELPEIEYQLGLLYYRVSNHDLARSHLNQCLSLDAGHLMARSLLGKLKR